MRRTDFRMQRYRFIVFDEHKLIAEIREFPATDDGTAVQVAKGWCDVRGGQVWRGAELIKHWQRGRGRPASGGRMHLAQGQG